MNVNQVEVLNKKIKANQQNRTKAETRREMLMSNLNSEIDKYESMYGVSLRGENLKETIKNISKEQKAIASALEEEYTLKSAVISAIEEGNIEKANELLGISEETDSEYVLEEDVVEDEVAEEVSEGAIVDDAGDEDFGMDFDEAEEEDDEDEDDDGEGFDDLDFGVDEEDAVEDYSNLGSSVDEVVKELDSEEDDEYEDLGDVDFDDFGFGDMLSGSKLDF